MQTHSTKPAAPHSHGSARGTTQKSISLSYYPTKSHEAMHLSSRRLKPLSHEGRQADKGAFNCFPDEYTQAAMMPRSSFRRFLQHNSWEGTPAALSSISPLLVEVPASSSAPVNFAALPVLLHANDSFFLVMTQFVVKDARNRDCRCRTSRRPDYDEILFSDGIRLEYQFQRYGFCGLGCVLPLPSSSRLPPGIFCTMMSLALMRTTTPRECH